MFLVNLSLCFSFLGVYWSHAVHLVHLGASASLGAKSNIKEYDNR